MGDRFKNRYDTNRTIDLLTNLRDRGLNKEDLLDLKKRCQKVIEHIDWNLSSKEPSREMFLDFDNKDGVKLTPKKES